MTYILTYLLVSWVGDGDVLLPDVTSRYDEFEHSLVTTLVLLDVYKENRNAKQNSELCSDDSLS